MFRILKPATLFLATAVSLFLSFGRPSFAGQVSICNSADVTVRVSTGVVHVFVRSWGWERIRPGQCKAVAGRFNGGYISFYIEYLHDPFSKHGNTPFIPENGDFVQNCVNLDSNFDYLYNDRGCEGGLVGKEFFQVYSESPNYTLTIGR